ncbi:hypothetical protein MMC13_004623 [Lambiella insularis]|nr:hypothetical protein [Lambiella insularis]
MALDSLITSPFIYAVILLSVYTICSIFTARSALPPNLPWVGLPHGWLPKTRARFASLTQGIKFLNLMEEKYTSKGLGCIFPSFLGDSEILVPPIYTSWLVNQPENVLSVHHNIVAKYQTDYTFLSPLVVADPISGEVIKRDLTRQIASLTDGMMEEAGKAFNKEWPVNNSNWHEVCVYKTLQSIIARTSYSVFVNRSLSNNDEFIEDVIKYAHDVPISALVLKLFPKFMKPLVGPLITFPNRWHYWRSGKHAIPVIRERVANFRRKQEDPESTYEEPNDFLGWHIRLSAKSPNPVEMTPEMIWLRLLVVGFTSLHTTSFTITNAILDLASSPPEKGYLQTLREEAEQVYAEEGGRWTKAGLAKMIHMDSAIRESMRLNGIITRGPQRMVVAENGVTMANGLHLPKGAHVGIASYGTRFNEQYYENSRDYDAFRFSRQRQELLRSTAKLSDGKEAPAILKQKNLALVTTTEDFPQFGHGRFACSGRFFAAAEMKLMLAYMVLNYDIEPLAERPPGEWLGDTILPPRKAKIWVRRRQDSKKE